MLESGLSLGCALFWCGLVLCGVGGGYVQAIYETGMGVMSMPCLASCEVLGIGVMCKIFMYSFLSMLSIVGGSIVCCESRPLR